MVVVCRDLGGYCIFDMRNEVGIFHMCRHIYMCMISHGKSGWLFIFIICKYGDMLAGVGILLTFPGKAYLLCISVSRPPLLGLYGILCCMHLVKVCVLLKMSLYSGNKFCIYLVDLVAVSFVSCMFMIAVFVGVLFMRFCRFGRVVLSEDAFHVMMLVSWFMSKFVLGKGVGVFGVDGGCEYSFRFSKQRNDSAISLVGRKGNSFWSVIGVCGVFWLWIDSYNSL